MPAKATTEWVRRAAEVLYEKMESIIIEAEQEAQIQQDSEAGRWIWTNLVAGVIAEEFTRER